MRISVRSCIELHGAGTRGGGLAQSFRSVRNGAMQHPGLDFRRIPLPRRWVNKALGGALALLADYQDGAVRVSNHRIGDTTDQGPAYPTEPPAAHRYQVDAQLLGQDDYLLVGSP
jgi:hypothetical protein